MKNNIWAVYSLSKTNRALNVCFTFLGRQKARDFIKNSSDTLSSPIKYTKNTPVRKAKKEKVNKYTYWEKSYSNQNRGRCFCRIYRRKNSGPYEYCDSIDGTVWHFASTTPDNGDKSYKWREISELEANQIIGQK